MANRCIQRSDISVIMPAISKVILFIVRVQTGHKLFETFAKYLERKLVIDTAQNFQKVFFW